MVFEELARRVINSDDLIKLFFWCPQLLFKTIFLWPGSAKKRRQRFIAFIYFSIINIFFGIGIFLNFNEHSSNFNDTMYQICIFEFPLMAQCKLIFLWYNSDKLKNLIKQVKQNFWRYDLFGGKSKTMIEKYYKNSNVLILTFFSAGIIDSTLMMFIPLIRQSRCLPFNVEYYVDTTITPFYQFLYLHQFLAIVATAMPIVIGMNILFLSLIITLTSQYCILQEYFLAFNTPEMVTVNKIMRIVVDDGLEYKYQEEKEFFVRCVKHHQMLLRYMKKFNAVFNPLEISQLFFGVYSICFGIYRITSRVEMNILDNGVNFLFILGNLIQLSVDCYSGDLLYHQGSLLSEAIFHSQWYELEKRFQKDVLFFMKQSQRIPRLSAYYLFDIHLISFLKVLKLSFSFYTLLSSLSDK